MESIKHYIHNKMPVYIHCPTLDIARKLNELLISYGRDGLSHIQDNWAVYRENFALSTKYPTTYADLVWPKSNGFTIIEYTEITELALNTLNETYSIF